MKKEEEWVDIEGWEDFYEVSSLGRVRSKDRELWNGATWYIKEGRVLKPDLKKHPQRKHPGMLRVVLRSKPENEAVTVKRLVAEAFMGLDRNDKSKFVQQITNDEFDCSIGNLVIVEAEDFYEVASIMRVLSSKAVFCIDSSGNKKTFKTAVEAAKEEGVHLNSIYRRIEEKHPIKGFDWGYLT